MSSFQVWKDAKFVFDSTEEEYCAAHNAVIEAGRKRSEAWEKLTIAARNLTPADEIKAKEFEFGPALSNGERA